MKNTIILLFLFCLGYQASAQVAKAKSGTFLLKSAELYTITDGIQKGDLLIKDGKIAAIGGKLPNEVDATEIDCSGKRVYPGLIDSGTKLGLGEISAVSLTNDYNEIGEFIPQMQALTAVNPNSVSIPVTRVNGVTTVIAKPEGGLFPGTAALINLLGYTPDQMYAGFKGVVMNYPSSGRRGRWDRRSDEDRKKEEEKKLKKINDVWDNAVLYNQIASAAKGDEMPDYQPGMEAMRGVVNGSMALMLEVNKDKDILSAIRWVKEKDIKKVIFTGVDEGWRVADSLAQANIPVVTGPILSVPGRSSDRYDIAYKNAGLMQQAGVKVAIRTDETENVRNLPFNAGFAAAYGMGIEEALKAVTIVPAEIFGVADKIGSLTKGKIANIVVCDGDIFETKTQISHLFIDGYQVPIDSRHIQLYEEFLERTHKP